MSGDHYDLIVIGGGPTGSTLAAFTAMAGHRVLLLERETFPRHQIGESLLPATVHGICRMLGIFDEVERQEIPTQERRRPSAGGRTRSPGRSGSAASRTTPSATRTRSSGQSSTRSSSTGRARPAPTCANGTTCSP